MAVTFSSSTMYSGTTALTNGTKYSSLGGTYQNGYIYATGATSYRYYNFSTTYKTVLKCTTDTALKAVTLQHYSAGTTGSGTMYVSKSSSASSYASSSNLYGSATITVKSSSQTTTVNLTKPIAKGATFYIWLIGSSSTAVSIFAQQYASTGKAVPGGTTVATYTVSYNANGGTGAPSSQTKYNGYSLTLSTTKPTKATTTSTSNFTITGNANGGDANKTATATKSTPTTYAFKNWNTKSGGTGTSYASGASYTGNAALSLYAQYTGTTGATTYSNNTLAALGTPTRSGYSFVGWGSSASATTPLASTTSYTSATTVYAIWKADGGVTIFDADGNPRTAIPYVYHNDEWCAAIPYVYHNDDWRTSTGG